MKPIIRAQTLSNKCKKVKSTGLPKKEQWILADTAHWVSLSIFVCKMPRGGQQEGLSSRHTYSAAISSSNTRNIF